MTMPNEAENALNQARELLEDQLYPSRRAASSDAWLAEVNRVLRHYPSESEVHQLVEALQMVRIVSCPGARTGGPEDRLLVYIELLEKLAASHECPNKWPCSICSAPATNLELARKAYGR